MKISRRTLVLGAGIVAGAGALSLPGGGPRTLFGGVAPEHAVPSIDERFSPEVLRAELGWLDATMREVGLRPFAYTSESEYESRYAAVVSALNRPMNVAEFYRHVGPLFASLCDGHAGVFAGAAFDRYRENGGLAFPLLLFLRERGVYIGTQTEPDLPKGTQILTVDGQDARAIAREVVAFCGAQTTALRYAFAGYGTASALWALYGVRPRYEIRALRPDGRVVELAVPARTRAFLVNATKRFAGPTPDPYTFSRIAGGAAGYIDYRSCEDLPRFKHFLADTFASIQRRPVQGLIIDIRRNGGGSSSLNNVLWSYVTDKPFAQFGNTLVKVSNRLKREYGLLKYNDIYPPPAWFWPDGSVIEGSTGLTRPGANPLRYTGPVYLLIGTGTFSSALACAVAARDFELATIVGEETAEPVNTTGEVYSGFSPRLGLAFGFTTKFFYGPKTRPDRQGVLPDVTIAQTEDDVRTGRDPVLRYVIDAIEKHHRG